MTKQLSAVELALLIAAQPFRVGDKVLWADRPAVVKCIRQFCGGQPCWGDGERLTAEIEVDSIPDPYIETVNPNELTFSDGRRTRVGVLVSLALKYNS